MCNIDEASRPFLGSIGFCGRAVTIRMEGIWWPEHFQNAVRFVIARYQLLQQFAHDKLVREGRGPACGHAAAVDPYETLTEEEIAVIEKALHSMVNGDIQLGEDDIDETEALVRSIKSALSGKHAN